MLRFTFPYPVTCQGFLRLSYIKKTQNNLVINYPYIIQDSNRLKFKKNNIKILGYNLDEKMENHLDEKEDIKIKYNTCVELINIGNVKENNWSDINTILDKRDKMYFENYLHMQDNQRNYYKINDFELILWRSDKHQLKYNYHEKAFELTRNN
jgi:hypothetical protein